MSTIPAFDSRRSKNSWFAVSLISIIFGVWFAYTWDRSGGNPGHYGIDAGSLIRYGWAIAAIGFSLSGCAGFLLGAFRIYSARKDR